MGFSIRVAGIAARALSSKRDHQGRDDDWSALETALGSPEAAAGVQDERNFIDHARTAFFVSEEHHVICQRAHPVHLP